jgi:hypothetical protein
MRPTKVKMASTRQNKEAGKQMGKRSRSNQNVKGKKNMHMAMSRKR